MRSLHVAVVVTSLAVAQLGAAALQQAAPSLQERDFLSRTRRITVEGRRSGEGPYCHEHNQVAYQPAQTKKKASASELARSLRRYI